MLTSLPSSRPGGRRWPPPLAAAHPFREVVQALLVAILLGLFARTFLVQVFRIPSASMDQTLLAGDFVLVNKWIYAGGPGGPRLVPTRSPRRGDVIVFKSPENSSLVLAKRCVGLPGERVEVREHRLWIDGQRHSEDAYLQLPEVGDASLHRTADPRRIPAGHYFFLGDNRAFSRDSRVWGTVPRKLLRGRIILVLWSTAFAAEGSQAHGFEDQTPRGLDALRSLLLARRDRWLKPVR